MKQITARVCPDQLHTSFIYNHNAKTPTRFSVDTAARELITLLEAQEILFSPLVKEVVFTSIENIQNYILKPYVLNIDMCTNEIVITQQVKDDN